MAELRTVFAAERGAQLIGRWVAKRFENTKGTDGETGEPKGQLFVAKITGFDPKCVSFEPTSSQRALSVEVADTVEWSRHSAPFRQMTFQDEPVHCHLPV